LAYLNMQKNKLLLSSLLLLYLCRVYSMLQSLKMLHGS
jgi:hypothetical protein